MPNQIQTTVSVDFYVNGIPSYDDGDAAATFSLTGSDYFAHGGWATSTVDTALPLGSLTAPFSFGYFRNMDTNNYIKIKSAVSGTVLSYIPPNVSVLLYFDSTITAPSAVSVAGAPPLRYVIFQV